MVDEVEGNGDLLGIAAEAAAEVTAIVDEHYGDTSRMFCIGKTPIKANNLIDATYESMMKAIKIIKEDIHLGDIGATIQNHVEAEGFSVVQDFCGHGIGQSFHEEPTILHYGKMRTGKNGKKMIITRQTKKTSNICYRFLALHAR